jgi:hypothetical protein
MSVKARLRAVGAVSWPAVLWIAAATVFFRDFLLSGFDSIAGDPGDARFDVFIREHFYRFLRGTAEFTSPPMFFPVKDTLGYSDGYLLDSLIYVPLRIAGADPYLSFELVCIALSLVGFVSVNVLVVRYGRARQPIAAFVACLFSFSNALFIKIGHPQMLEVNVIPVVAALFAEAARRSDQGLRRMVIPGFLGGFIFALLFSTGYYVAWFSALILALTLAASLVISNGVHLQGYLAQLRSRAGLGIIAASGFALGLIPFLRVYGPVLVQHPVRDFAEYLTYAPFPSDIVNVGRFNVIWGRAVSALSIVAADHRGNGEVTLAVTPVLLITYIFLVFRIWRGRLLAAPEDLGLRAGILGSFVALVVLWAITVRVGQFSLFWLAWHAVPGAGAIRAGGRVQIVANGFIVAVVAIALTRKLNETSAFRHKAIIWGLVLLCAAEQANTTVNHRLSRVEQLAFLDTVPLPPTGCRSFFVAANASKSNPDQQVDAILIAQRVGLPTVNGYSGLAPPGWPLGDVKNSAYRSQVWEWANDHQLADRLCEYDVTRREWSNLGDGELERQLDAVSPPAMGTAVTAAGLTLDMRAGGNAEVYRIGSWSAPEQPGTWTDGARAGFAVPLENWQGDMTLEVTGRPFLVPKLHPALAIDVLVNGSPVAHWSYLVEQDNHPVTRTARIPATVIAASPVLRILFRIEKPQSPSATGESEDHRKLGLFVSHVLFRAQDSGSANPGDKPNRTGE